VIQIGRSVVRSQLVSLEIFVDIKSFRSHYGPGVDSASNRNEYQEHFLGVKTADAQGRQPYHHPVLLSWNLGKLTSWNPLGHSRPVKGLIYLFTDKWSISLSGPSALRMWTPICLGWPTQPAATFWRREKILLYAVWSRSLSHTSTSNILLHQK